MTKNTNNTKATNADRTSSTFPEEIIPLRDDIIGLDFFDSVRDRVLSAAGHGYNVIITGDAGSGLTTLCDFVEIETNPSFRVFRNVGFGDEEMPALRHIHFMLTGRAINSMDYRFGAIATTVAVLAKEFRRQGYRILLFDRADEIPCAITDLLYQLQDACLNLRHKISIVFARRNRIDPQMQLFSDITDSRVYYRANIPRLTEVETVQLLEVWCENINEFRRGLTNGDPDASATLASIMASTKGRVSSLRMFADYKNDFFPKTALSANIVLAIARKRIGGDIAKAAA